MSEQERTREEDQTLIRNLRIALELSQELLETQYRYNQQLQRELERLRQQSAERQAVS